MRGLIKQENNRKTNNKQKKSPHMQGVYSFFQLDRKLLGGFPVKSEVILI